MSGTPTGLPLAPDQDEDAGVNPEILMLVGEIVRMMSQSPDHRDYSIAQLENRFLLPASMDQIRVYRSPTEPVGVVTWALVSDEIHAKLEAGSVDLQPEDWRSGDNLWIMEVIRRPDVADMIRDDLVQQVFPNKIGKMRVYDDDTKAWTVETYYGANRQGDAKAAVH